MTCASCVTVNQNSLNDLEGVISISINLATNMANIEFDETKMSFPDIKKDIESNGFKVNEKLENQSEEKKDNKILKRFIFSAIFSLPVFSMMF
jgi:Cu+-exporting ATPase